MRTKSPDVLAISSTLILLAAALTWILPGGAYERRPEQVGASAREVVVPGSFRVEPHRPQLAEVLVAPARGFLRMGSIIVFILIVGGAFNILNDTGAMAAGIHQLLRVLAKRSYLLIPLVMVVFSFFGGAFGMAEEAIPFTLIFVPLAIALGYDSLVGVCLTFVAANVGFSAGFTNPFTVQVSQQIAGVAPLSGIGYRLVLWALVTVITTAWVMAYAARVKANPQGSPVYDLDQVWRDGLAKSNVEEIAFTWRHGVCLAILFGAVAGLIAGVTIFKWGIMQLAGLFFAMGLAAGAAAGIGPNRLAKSFVVGAKDLLGAALVVAFAGGIVTLLEDGHILDTILYGLASVTAHVGGVIAAQAMYILTIILNFFIPSGSTKAVLTMPLLAPLADLSGITRQTVVLAYQLGAGFTCLIMPTSGVTVGTLAIAKVPFERWLKWQLPMQAAFLLFSLLALVWPVLAHWS